MASKKKKKVARTPAGTSKGRKPSKKTAKKRKTTVKVSSTSTTKKRKKSAKKRKVTVKSHSTSTTHHKKSKKKASKRSVRKYANKAGKAWKAFMAKEEGVARPMSGPMTRRNAAANERLIARIAEANKAIKTAHEKIAAAKPERAKPKKASRRKYANKAGKAWNAFMAKEGKAKRPMQGPVRRVKKARAKKTEQKTVTAADILSGAKKTFKIKAWLCAGPKRTGCGGGKKGGHVLASL